MSVLLTSNCNLASSSFGHINSGGDSRATITSPRAEVVRSFSVSSHQSHDDDGKQQNSTVSYMPVIKETSIKPPNIVTNNANKERIPVSDTWLKRIKRCYEYLYLNYLFSLAFMMIYMFIGAFLFLWLEGASDQARKLHEYKFYIHERKLFLKQLDEIYKVKVSRRQTLLLKEAIDNLHRQIGVSFSNQSDWSLATALYYSGTVFTTIGYGDVACNTSSGRLMTVIYAIIGIPLMLITLRDLGNFLYKVMINAVRLMHFTSNKCRIFGRRIYETSIQQNNFNMSNLSQLEKGHLSTDTSNNNIDHENENNDDGSRKPKFQLDEIKEEKEEAKMANHDAMILNNYDPPARIPVLMAIGTTFSWIFVCAGLFKMWEHDWTYAESCYFMFISLSTIGLGDLAVRRRDLMTMCFVFVIIGLAMVSMCINVIQTALEDFYINIFLKLFLEYQSKLNQGDGAVGASMGVMRMWDNNKAAKYLMPLLREQTLMITVMDTAIVTDSLTNEMIETAVQCSNPVMLHCDTQTEVVELRDNECITVIPEYMESDVQTEEVRLLEQEIQTHIYDVLEAFTQTEAYEYNQKPIPEMMENEVQTDIISSRVKELSQATATQGRRISMSPSVSGWTNFSEDEEATDEDVDSNNLDWDPVDGMHAEKQRRVRDLKEFFETSEKELQKDDDHNSDLRFLHLKAIQ
ncbi:BMA-TWK-8 [Dirofilaria immitis]|nr:BMA-TWK-8 [Dirofilaria immitis]